MAEPAAANATTSSPAPSRAQESRAPMLTRTSRSHSDPDLPVAPMPKVAASVDRAALSMNNEAERERRMAAIRQKVQDKKNEQGAVAPKKTALVPSPPPSVPSPSGADAPAAPSSSSALSASGTRVRATPPRPAVSSLSASLEQLAPSAEEGITSPLSGGRPPATTGRHSATDVPASKTASSPLGASAAAVQKHRRTGSSTPPKATQQFAAPRAIVPTLGDEEPVTVAPRTKSMSARSIPRLQRSKSGVDVMDGLVETREALVERLRLRENTRSPRVQSALVTTLSEPITAFRESMAGDVLGVESEIEFQKTRSASAAPLLSVSAPVVARPAPDPANQQRNAALWGAVAAQQHNSGVTSSQRRSSGSDGGGGGGGDGTNKRPVSGSKQRPSDAAAQASSSVTAPPEANGTHKTEKTPLLKKVSGWFDSILLYGIDKPETESQPQPVPAAAAAANRTATAAESRRADLTLDEQEQSDGGLEDDMRVDSGPTPNPKGQRAAVPQYGWGSVKDRTATGPAAYHALPAAKKVSPSPSASGGASYAPITPSPGSSPASDGSPRAATAASSSAGGTALPRQRPVSSGSDAELRAVEFMTMLQQSDIPVQAKLSALGAVVMDQARQLDKIQSSEKSKLSELLETIKLIEEMERRLVALEKGRRNSNQ